MILLKLPILQRVFACVLGLTISLSAVEAAPVKIVSEGVSSACVVVSKDSPEFTRRGAEELVHYISEISGVRLPILNEPDETREGPIIWVGAHPALAKRHPGLDSSMTTPEETLIQTVDDDVILLGRDIVGVDGAQLEAGTYLAVSSFIEEQLGVRWLWPGELGTDIPKAQTIRVEPLSIRYTPQVRLRSLRYTNYERSYRELSSGSKERLSQFIEDPLQWARHSDREARRWLNFHRTDAPSVGSKANCLAGSLANYRNRHAFSDWYKKYGVVHPEWFALQPDGTRTPYPKPTHVKMCVSNPGVAAQWVRNAKEFFEKNPNASTFEAAENDYGWQGYCVCENCVAMDNKDAELLEQDLRWSGVKKSSYALTDRYVKFWNSLARELKKEFPNREVNVASYAYHVTRPAPSLPLEKNIIPTFIGIERRFYHRNNREHTLEQRKMWDQWWEAADRRAVLVWRPNILYKNMGLPYIFTKRHSENMRYVADRGLAGISFGGGGCYWAVQGPQLYLNVKLAWNPNADADAILADWYKRGFGPAAPFIAEYYQLFEDLYARLAEQYKDQGYSVYTDPPRLFREIRSDSHLATGRLGAEGVVRNRHIEDAAKELLRKANDAVAEEGEAYRKRVLFVETGFRFIEANLDSIEAMNDFTAAPSDETRKRAEDAANRRDALLGENAHGFAINYVDFLRELEASRRYLGPPEGVAPKSESDSEKQAVIQDLEA